MNKKNSPKVIRKLVAHDWLVEISDSKRGSGKTMILRMVYVYRKGFRRRRILTSLLDPVKYPSTELADLYHRRWDIETFYRDFKETMQARRWHCQTPDGFEKELAMHMIAATLIRTTMLEASKKRRIRSARLSFCRAVTEARVFLRRVAGVTAEAAYEAYKAFVKQCSLYVVKDEPGRSFSRDKQEYRAKSREIKMRGRRRKKTTAPFIMENSSPETLTNLKGETYALS